MHSPPVIRQNNASHSVLVLRNEGWTPKRIEKHLRAEGFSTTEIKRAFSGVKTSASTLRTKSRNRLAHLRSIGR